MEEEGSRRPSLLPSMTGLGANRGHLFARRCRGKARPTLIAAWPHTLWIRADLTCLTFGQRGD
jgi:hypothetical protein